jgi:photosystem II stability/assembly factor-like uncharacterized protein
MRKLISFLVLCAILFAQSISAQTAWVQQTSGVTSDLNAVDFVNENYGFAAGAGGVILKTTNGGSTWSPLTSGTTVDFFDVLLIDQNNGFVVGSGGTILRTTDGGSNWSTLPSSVSDNLFSISINETFGLIGGSSQTILSTTNGGASWNEVQSGFFGGGFWGTSVINSTSGVVAGQNSIFQPMIALTTDTGVNWEFTPFYLNTNEGRLNDCHFFDANNGFTAAAVWDGQGAISRTTNSGVNWITTLFPQALFGMDFPTAATAYAVGANGYIIKSVNGGLNWESQPSGTSGWLNDVSFANAEVGYVVGDAGLILKTTQGGIIPVELTSFTASVSGSNVTLNWSTASEKNNLGFEVQRQVGSLQSAVGNEDWETIGFVEGNGTTTEISNYSFINNLNLTHNHTLYYRLKQIDFDGSFEYSNIIEVEIGLPTQFVLEQNYPNPFNPVTTISWQSPVASHQVLKVFDVLGNEVATLVDEFRDAGRYEVTFDASTLNSGVYLYRLTTNNFSSTKKMTLIQ